MRKSILACALFVLALSAGCQTKSPSPESPPPPTQYPSPAGSTSTIQTNASHVDQPDAESESEGLKKVTLPGPMGGDPGTTPPDTTPPTLSQPPKAPKSGIDCSRIKDPAYQEKLKGEGIDPDSKDCEEEDLLD